MAIYGCFLNINRGQVPFAARCKRRINEMRHTCSSRPTLMGQKREVLQDAMMERIPPLGRGDPAADPLLDQLLHLEKNPAKTSFHGAISLARGRGKSWGFPSERAYINEALKTPWRCPYKK